VAHSEILSICHNNLPWAGK